MESFLSQSGALLPVLLLAGMGGLVAWLLRKEAGRRAAQREHMIRMGYTPVASPPDGLAERIARLRGCSRGSMDLRHVFEQSLQGGRLYVFDVRDDKHSENTAVGTGLVAVVAPSLRLPRFYVMPRLELPRGGWMTRAVEKLVQVLAAKAGVRRLETPISPAFDERYWLFGADAREVREFLGNGRGTRLAGLEARYAIHAGGDTFTVEPAPQTSRRRANATLELERRVEDAKRMLSWFA
jgi:hypothetical protein